MRKARVSTISFAGAGGSGSTEEKIEMNRKAALELLETASLDKPDIVCLPETFTGLGLELKEWIRSAEPVPGPTTEAVSKLAKERKMYVVCPIIEKSGGKTYNSAVLVGRDGEVLGSYHKIHPTIGEIEAGITPGNMPKVFETDFGRVGLAICFDLNFRGVAEGLKEEGAELVFFPSMYPGGLQLSIWAHDMSFFVASAFTGNGSAIVDPLGRTLVTSSGCMKIISRPINLDFGVFHIDYNCERWPAIKGKYGPGVEIDVAEPEGVFALYCNLEGKTVEDLIEEFKLERRDEYFKRAEGVREKALR
ncbi:MAG: carbon-nitrogen hydrolase family protein [Candidatus Brockarchaeota archaeon]|nr:carbon-nitrogen hydrolase family protein [Candidatus Brockarchaeota archaeon]